MCSCLRCLRAKPSSPNPSFMLPELSSGAGLMMAAKASPFPTPSGSESKPALHSYLGALGRIPRAEIRGSGAKAA